MALSVKMFRCVFVLGGVAAAYMPSDQAQTQVDPCIAHLDAFLADMLVRVGNLDLVGVLALFCHKASQVMSRQVPAVSPALVGPTCQDQRPLHTCSREIQAKCCWAKQHPGPRHTLAEIPSG